MLKATLFIQRGHYDTVSNDDVIRIYDDDNHHEMVRVVYATPELTRTTEFITSIPEALSYVREILKSLPRDSEPFVSLQVTTAIHPSVMYSVEALKESDTRYIIEDAIATSLRLHTYRT